MKGHELEVKYFVSDLYAMQQKLVDLGAELVQPRTFENNLRYDTPTGELSRSFRVVRLRQDTAARMTYKGPSRSDAGVRVRQEIEFVVDNFEAAHEFLLALGYMVSMAYEKYRTVYDLDEVHVTLDEMPYGSFVELEGPDPDQIQAVNTLLRLDWDARLPESYTMIFERLRAALNLPFRDLTFQNFENLSISAAEINARPADLPG